MYIGLQGKEQVSQQPLVHWRPLEFWDAEHGCAWARTELPTLLLGHGHAPETQVDTEIALQLGCGAAMEGLQIRSGKVSVSHQKTASTFHCIKPFKIC